MRLDQALAQLEPLRHRDRVARCVSWGRQAARGDEEASALLREMWAQPGAYPRSLALWAWFGSRDVELLLAALQDDSCTLRRRAAHLVHHLSDEDVLRALPLVAHAPTLRSVLVRLSRQRRQAVIDTFLRALPPQDTQSSELVPFASPEVAAAWTARQPPRPAPPRHPPPRARAPAPRRAPRPARAGAGGPAAGPGAP
jgi:hypothetical protein